VLPDDVAPAASADTTSPVSLSTVDPSEADASTSGRTDIRSAATGVTPGSVAKPAAPGFWESLLTSLSATTASGTDGQTRGTGHLTGEGSGEAGQDPGPLLLGAALPVQLAAPLIGRGVVDFAERITKIAAQSDALELDSASDAAAFLPSGLQTLVGAPGLAQNTAVMAASLPVPHVAAQISAALSQGADGATELALSPEELGHVRLRLERDPKHPDRMVVMITFERPETMDLFRRHAGELAEALRSAGFAGADIGFGQQGSGSSGADGAAGRPGSSPEHGPERGPEPGRELGPGGPADVPSPPSSSARLGPGISLDLRM
jgi:Flagellar hook-length control protein FliK